MSYELLSGLVLFAFVSSGTPGPNNLMLMASGANFGFRRTIPHMLGISIGFAIMALCVGAGLMQLFDRFPVSYTLLKIGAVLYMSWLAWKIAHAAPPEDRIADESARPFTFLQAAAFQWVNPKAWAMALTAITGYAPARDLAGVALVALVFSMVNLPTVSCWTILGQQFRRWLNSPKRLRAFNLTMAALLIASLIPVLLIAPT